MVNALAFPDVLALFEYWADSPPAHLLLKGMAGFKGRGARRSELNQWEQQAEAGPVLPEAAVPAYVREVMNRHKQEQASATER